MHTSHVPFDLRQCFNLNFMIKNIKCSIQILTFRNIFWIFQLKNTPE